MVLKDNNNEIDGLGLEISSDEGLDWTDVSNMEQIKANELNVGSTFVGKPEIMIFENDEVDKDGKFIRNYDSIRLRLIDEPEYLDGYINIPKSKNGNISNIRKGFDFYRTCFDVIFSFLRFSGEKNVIDPVTGEEIKRIKKINIENFIDILNSKSRIGIKITEGSKKSDYNSFEIISME